MLPDPNSSAPAILDAAWLLNILVGGFLPWAVGKVLSSQASAQYRAIGSFLICFVVGLLSTYLGKTWVGVWSSDPNQNIYVVVFNLITVLGTAWTAYDRFWRNFVAFRRVNDAPEGLGQ